MRELDSPAGCRSRWADVPKAAADFRRRPGGIALPLTNTALGEAKLFPEQVRLADRRDGRRRRRPGPAEDFLALGGIVGSGAQGVARTEAPEPEAAKSITSATGGIVSRAARAPT